MSATMAGLMQAAITKTVTQANNEWLISSPICQPLKSISWGHWAIIPAPCLNIQWVRRIKSHHQRCAAGEKAHRQDRWQFIYSAVCICLSVRCHCNRNFMWMFNHIHGNLLM